jgi:hypothetical protein
MNDYHLFKKEIIGKKGKKSTKWYYWYYDKNGKQVQKACRRCSTKVEASAYIENLPPYKVCFSSYHFRNCSRNVSPRE